MTDKRNRGVEQILDEIRGLNRLENCTVTQLSFKMCWVQPLNLKKLQHFSAKYSGMLGCFSGRAGFPGHSAFSD